MKIARSSLRRWAALAAMAMLCLAMAPGFAQWLKASQGLDVWSEVCVSPRQKASPWMSAVARSAVFDDVSPADSSPPTTSSGTMDHCPWCAHFGGAWLPGVPQVLPLPLGTESHPALFYQAPRLLFAWATAQPRGPPTQA